MLYVSDRAIDVYGERVTSAFVARRLNAFVERVGTAEAFACLGRAGDPVELAPDGTVDEG